MGNISLLNNDAHSLKAYFVKGFLDEKKAQVLDYSPYSLDLAPMRLFLFRILKSVPAGSRHDSRKSLVAASYQCLKDIPITDFQKCSQKLVNRLKHSEKVRKYYFEGNKC